MKKKIPIKDYVFIALSCIIIYYSFSMIYDTIVEGKNPTVFGPTAMTKYIKPDSLYGHELVKFEIFSNEKSAGFLPQNKVTFIIGYNANTTNRLRYLNTVLSNITNLQDSIKIIVLSLDNNIKNDNFQIYSYQREVLEKEYGITNNTNFIILVDVNNKIRYFMPFFNENTDLRLLLERYTKEDG
ncbi:hypothetical protein AMJ80_02655 [bacterium SM23_31]|nr:MAG: hypothetical protein AMJ80_02655 [bacterium SM23_31]